MKSVPISVPRFSAPAAENKVETLIQLAGAKNPHRLCLYLPSQSQDGSVIEEFEDKADQIAQLLCGHFGGATSYPATGHFTGRGGIQRESVRVVEFYCSSAKLAEERKFVQELVIRLRSDFNQESMALSVNGSLILLSGDE